MTTENLNAAIAADQPIAELNETMIAVAGDEWDRFYAAWSIEIANLGINVSPLFQDVNIACADVARNGKEEIDWWGKDSIEANAAKAARVYDGIVTSMGEYDHCARNHGVKKTLSYLHALRNDPKAVSAVLCAASLRARLFASCEGFVPVADDLAAREVFNEISWIYENALSYLRAVDAKFSGWWPTLKLSVPSPVGARVAAQDMPKVLAGEHAALLSAYVPVILKAVHDEARTQAVAAVTGHRSATWYDGRRAKAADRYAKEREDRLANSAVRQDSWEKLAKADLERLVWTKATRLVAKDYGVSDVAFAKRCKKEGVSKPPRGFWRKVEKNYIPHPNGVKPSDDVLTAIELPKAA